MWCTSMAAMAQSASLKGIVTDAASGEKIQFATVVASPGGHSTQTDADGRFAIGNLQPGNYKL